MESALTVLAFLLGHCWQTPLPDRAIDTHCFTEEKPGALVRDRHAVRKDGKIVYTGETAFTIAPSGVLRFHYTGSTGADIGGPMHADGDKIIFDDTDNSGTTTFWRQIDPEHFEDVTSGEVESRKLYVRVSGTRP